MLEVDEEQHNIWERRMKALKGGGTQDVSRERQRRMTDKGPIPAQNRNASNGRRDVVSIIEQDTLERGVAWRNEVHFATPS